MMAAHPGSDHGDIHSHVHEPNPEPPNTDAMLTLVRPDGHEVTVTPDDLARLPQTTTACKIAATGHPASGPFTFGGVRLIDLLSAYGIATWEAAHVLSGDGFGAYLTAQEARTDTHPILLATTLDGAPLTRRQGLVRLIVPLETGDALRQVKWVARIEVR